MEPLPEITEAYVKSLADPLITYTDEPIDTQSVLAIAVRAALYEAWEVIKLAEIGLRRDKERKERGEPQHLAYAMQCYGEVYAGTKVIRRVADALRLMPDARPTVPTAESVRAAMAQLDGSVRSAVSLLTGMTTEQLDELGGTDG